MFLGNLGNCIESSVSQTAAGQTLYTTFNQCLFSQLRGEGYSEYDARQGATTWTYGPSSAGEAPGYQQGSQEPSGYTPPAPAPYYSGAPAPTPAPAPMANPYAPPTPTSAPAPQLGPLVYPGPTITTVDTPAGGGEPVHMFGQDSPTFGTDSAGNIVQVTTQETGGFPWILAAAAAALLLL